MDQMALSPSTTKGSFPTQWKPGSSNIQPCPTQFPTPISKGKNGHKLVDQSNKAEVEKPGTTSGGL